MISYIEPVAESSCHLSVASFHLIAALSAAPRLTVMNASISGCPDAFAFMTISLLSTNNVSTLVYDVAPLTVRLPETKTSCTNDASVLVNVATVALFATTITEPPASVFDVCTFE